MAGATIPKPSATKNATATRTPTSRGRSARGERGTRPSSPADPAAASRTTWPAGVAPDRVELSPLGAVPGGGLVAQVDPGRSVADARPLRRHARWVLHGRRRIRGTKYETRRAAG